MFHRISVAFFLLFALPLFAAAAAVMPRDGDCNTGSISCCNSTVDSTSAQGTSILGLLGITLGQITGLIGLNCSPLSLGLGGNSCSQQPVCCTNNQFNGLINLGCSPININL